MTAASGGSSGDAAGGGVGGSAGDGGLTTNDATGLDSGAPAPSADTWDGYAKGFFATYCVSCHDDDGRGTATRDYHILANVMKEKVGIACGVVKSRADWTKRGCTGFPPERQFPVGNGPRPSDAERDRLVRWIDANTP